MLHPHTSIINLGRDYAGFQCIAAGMNYSPIDAQMHKSLGELKGFDPEMHCDRLHDLV